MRIWNLASFTLLILLSTGCGRQADRDTPAPAVQPLVRLHFAGIQHITTQTNAPTLLAVWQLPESHRLLNQSLDKLSKAPAMVFPGEIDAEHSDPGAALLRPLLDDLVARESFLQVLERSGQPDEWTLLVRLPADRLAAWKGAVDALISLWKLGAPASRQVDGVACLEVRRDSDGRLIRWAATGEWFALGVGKSGVPSFDEALKRIQSQGRPVQLPEGSWLEAGLDLSKLAGRAGYREAWPVPFARISIGSQGENVRTAGKLDFAQPAIGPMEPWDVPLRLINEPLVSFAAANGVGPMLASVPLLKDIGLSRPPNQLYVWGQAQVELQNFCAWPDDHALRTVEGVAKRFPEWLGEDLKKRGLADIDWDPTNRSVIWKRLPIMQPRLTAIEDKGRPFVMGGLFMPTPRTNPPPQELLSQVQNRSNLVLYAWEITQARLAQWVLTAQALAVASSKPQMPTNSAALTWLRAIGPHLGNTVTEISAESPVRWSLTRRSHIGLSGLELVSLGRWLESTNFPLPGFELAEVRPLATNRPFTVNPPKR